MAHRQELHAKSHDAATTEPPNRSPPGNNLQESKESAPFALVPTRASECPGVLLPLPEMDSWFAERFARSRHELLERSATERPNLHLLPHRPRSLRVPLGVPQPRTAPNETSSYRPKTSRAAYKGSR